MGRGRASAKMARVVVPGLGGLRVAEALAVTGPLGLALVGPDGGPPTSLAGPITGQRPAEGEQVAVGSAVTVTAAGPGDAAGMPALR